MWRREQVAKVLVFLKWLKYRRGCVAVSCCCCCCVLLLWVWMSSDGRKWRVWTFGRLWLGRVGRTHFLLCSFVFVFVKQKKRKKDSLSYLLRPCQRFPIFAPSPYLLFFPHHLSLDLKRFVCKFFFFFFFFFFLILHIYIYIYIVYS